MKECPHSLTLASNKPQNQQIITQTQINQTKPHQINLSSQILSLELVQVEVDLLSHLNISQNHFLCGLGNHYSDNYVHIFIHFILSERVDGW